MSKNRYVFEYIFYYYVLSTDPNLKLVCVCALLLYPLCDYNIA